MPKAQIAVPRCPRARDLCRFAPSFLNRLHELEWWVDASSCFSLDLISARNRIGHFLLSVMLLVETPVRLEQIGCRCVALRIDERRSPDLLLPTGLVALDDSVISATIVPVSRGKVERGGGDASAAGRTEESRACV